MEHSKKVILIRHAESEFNLMMEQAGGKEALLHLEAENISVKFNPNLMDCSITDKGYQQCVQAREEVKDLNIKIVIVSPLKRALETCYQIFKDHPQKPKVYIQPIFREMCLSSCDIGSKILESKAQYPDYDFSEIDKYSFPLLWNVDELNGQEKIDDIWRRIKEQVPQDRLNQDGPYALLNIMKNQFPYYFEYQVDCSSRLEKMRDIVKRYQQMLSSEEIVCIIAHSRVLQTLNAKTIKKNGDLEGAVFLNNCQVYPMEI